PAGSSRRKLPVYCKRLSNHPIERKIGRDERLHRGTVLSTKPGVFDRLPERACKSFHIPRRNEPACLSVVHDLATSWNVGGDDRAAARAGLKQGFRQAFAIVGGQADNLCLREYGRHVVSPSPILDQSAAC